MTRQFTSTFFPGTPCRPARWLIALIVFALAGLRAAPEAPGAESKDYSLFVGLDVSFKHDSVDYPLQQVSGSEIRLIRDKETLGLPIGSIRNFQLARNLKLSPYKIAVGSLQTKRTYSPAGNPMQLWARAELLMADMQDIPKARDMTADTSGIPKSNNKGTVSDAAATGISSLMAKEEYDKNLFDALEISFDVTSDQQIDKPYVVAVTEFRDESKPRAVSRSIIIRSLYPIFPGRTQTVSLEQNGFPKAFTPIKTSVHVYSSGRELASNLSGNLIPLTRMQACEYLIMQFLTANKGKTLPPSPALTPVPRDIRARLDASTLGKPIFVKVNKYGIVESAFRDETAKEKVDPYIDSVLANFHFTPALDKGFPVPGTTTVRLSDFLF
ncbi:MAG: hypothetical protein WC378_08055 [Opitutaceae bacterium]|jgi:hypothetical protein